MRATSEGPVLRVRAVAGVSVVLLAWDFVEEPDVRARAALPPAVGDLLGFALVRETLDGAGNVSERSVLKGIKRFRDKDAGLKAGTPVGTDQHPVQSFLWADYTPRPATDYRYTVTPVHGPHAKLLDVREADGTAVSITTEPEHDGRDGVSRHDMYFNRGVIGSQAFEREFPDVNPKDHDPSSRPMVWLSRGLFEGLVSFVAQASDERFALRGAFYEFKYQPAVDLFGQAAEAGADVKLVYEAEGGKGSYKDENEVALGRAGLLRPEVAIPRTKTSGIRHNKFVVLLEDGEPVAVWTGSTNISEGGLFGQTNIGHVVRDAAVATAYLEYWEALAGDPTVGALRTRAVELTPTPAALPPPGVTPLFSPRDGDKSTATLDWYAALIAGADRLVCMTLAFNFDPIFQTVMTPESDILRYIVKDKDLTKGETVGHDHDLLFAAGGRLPEGALVNFLGESDNPLNRNDYIHTKVLLIDPLGADPVVVTGSANFSKPSQRTNDENMLVIRGDTRVADCYIGEYMRIFDHHYARYIVAKLKAAPGDDPNAGYLKSAAAEWLPAHFSERSYKSKRRRYFAEDPDRP